MKIGQAYYSDCCCVFAARREAGVAGKFDVNLEWSYDEATVGMGKPSGPDSPPRPSIMDASDQELGVKPTSPKGPVEVLVIDHAEQPTAN